MVRFLLGCGAVILLNRDYEGKSELDYAHKSDSLQIIALLKASVDALEKDPEDTDDTEGEDSEHGGEGHDH
jgi:hypothetical protein